MELAKSRSNDNPVYYVQYAHARVASTLRRLGDNGWSLPDAGAVDLDFLEAPKEHALMVMLSRYPEVVQLAFVGRGGIPRACVTARIEECIDVARRCCACEHVT